MAIAGVTVVGRPFAVWPATLQMMPEGILDAGMGRFFLGVLVSNGSTQAWPATEVRISPRGRQVLNAAGIAINDGWSTGELAALGHTTNGEWIPIPALSPGGIQLIFFKLDVAKSTIGLHQLELELRAPTAPATTVKATAPLRIARTSCRGNQRLFTSACDEGTLTASVSSVTVDQESFRRVLGRARAMVRDVTPGTRNPADSERLRSRLRALLCGDDSDVCGVLADLTTTCALPTSKPPVSGPTSGAAALAIQSDQATTLGDRDEISGSVFSNHAVTIANDATISGDVTSGGDVTIGDRSRVLGNVTSAGVIRTNPNGGAVITGAQNQHATVTPMAIATKTVTPGTNNPPPVNSGTGTLANPYAIAPGRYGTIIVNSNNVISMSAGVYHIGQLILNADVTLILNQTAGAIVDVRVQSNLAFGDRFAVKVGSGPNGIDAQFYSNQTSELRVGTDIESFPLALAVPQGTVHVYSRTKMSAALAAKTVIFEPDVDAFGASIPQGSTDDWLGVGASGLEFLGYPTGLGFSVAYNGTFFGTVGPQPFGQVPWKALLANAVLQFGLGLPSAMTAEFLSTADQAVVGTVKNAVLNALKAAPGTTPPSSQAGSVDAATATVRGNRSLGAPWFSVLDAAPSEPNGPPVGALGGLINTAGSFLTNAEIETMLSQATTAPDNLKVYKSGAGTGVTRGIVSGLVPVLARDDETGTVHFINQLLIVPDPDAPATDAVAKLGDSGALWFQSSTNKVVGMTHTVGSGGAIVSRFQDVVSALQIQLA